MVLDDFCWLDQISASDRSVIGEKAFYLGLLRQRTYPVLPGFVVTTSALEHFLAQVNWQVQMFADLPHAFFYVDANNPRQLQTVAQQIRQAMLASPVDELLLTKLETAVQEWQTDYVILRPSFSLPPTLDPTLCATTHSLLAAQVCRGDQPSLAQGLKQVWAELFRARSLFYWQRLGIQLQQVRLAVLVQPMQTVLAAGDLQIVNQQIRIRAVRGLGYGLRQGVWDTYQMDLQSHWHDQQLGQQLYHYQIREEVTSRSGLETLPDIPKLVQLTLLDSRSSVQPVLPPDQQQQLALLAQQTQVELGMPLQLEWISVDSETTPKFWLTQVVPRFSSQPIFQATANPDAQSKSLVKQTIDQAINQPILHGLAAAPGRKIAPAWVVPQVLNPLDTATIPANVILVTLSLLPHQLLQLRQIAGIVTEQGGLTSHAAILARELGIPAVVSVPSATQRIQTGQAIGLDGDQGEVYCNSTGLPEDWQQTARSELEQAEFSQSKRPLGSSLNQNRLMITLSQSDRLAQFAVWPTDGIGLLRAEFLMLDLLQHQHPQAWLTQISQAEAIDQIAARIQPFVAAFAPRPVFYRSLDLRSAEFESQRNLAAPHPTLGWRGTLNDVLHPELLQMQLAALRQVQQQGYPHLSLILPFVRTVEEFVFCRRQVEQAELTQSPEFQLWIMAEVPSVLWLLPNYAAAGVQGICIGMNDLTQLLLGIDRDHPQMAAAFELYHPVVLQAVEQLVQTAHQLGLACSFCGQSLDRHPQVLNSLLQMGIHTFVVEPQEVLSIHRVLAAAPKDLMQP